MERIVIMESPEEQAMLKEQLTSGGFAVEFAPADETGIERVCDLGYSALLMAINAVRPNLSTLLRALRNRSRLPVILLVSPEREIEGIVGLESGADDYLLKPINQRILTARLQAIIRREQNDPILSPPPTRLILGSLEIDTYRRAAWHAGRILRLTAIEFDLLKEMIHSQGQVLSRELLYKIVLKRDYHPDDRSLDVHISKLRKKISPHKTILAIRGQGYILTSNESQSKDDEQFARSL